MPLSNVIYIFLIGNIFVTEASTSYQQVPSPPNKQLGRDGGAVVVVGIGVVGAAFVGSASLNKSLLLELRN